MFVQGEIFGRQVIRQKWKVLWQSKRAE